MSEIYIYPLFRVFFSKQYIQNVLRSIKSALNQNDEVIVSVAIMTNQKVKRLNYQYRNINQVTDVLSFNQDVVLENGKKFLGEIIIAFPRLVRQAKQKGISIKNELCLLIIHGYLHLNGYDHSTGKTKLAMWNVQNKLLYLLKIDPKYELGDE